MRADLFPFVTFVPKVTSIPQLLNMEQLQYLEDEFIKLKNRENFAKKNLVEEFILTIITIKR